jgi:hypothetical protein
MFNTQILAGSSGQGGETQQSLKFNDDESQYLSWTPAASGNRRTFTLSVWVKRGNIAASTIFSARVTSGTPATTFGFFNSTGNLNFQTNSSELTTNAIYRDPSSWYHIVLAVDTTQATSSNRAKLYVNGEQVTSFSSESYPAQNAETEINNSARTHMIGRNPNYRYFDGYMSDFYFIDGQALDASSFGETVDGYWKAKDYAGSYGTNGFHLTFQDDVVSEGFNAVTYRGNGGTQSVSGIGFEPSFVWIKQRNGTGYHTLFDAVRGATKNLSSNSTDQEATLSNHLTAFNGDGFTLGGNGDVNGSGNSYVAWAWDAGSGSAASNTDGSITSTVKANPSYGFSIVSYTGTGSAATIGHGLSSAPDMIITKARGQAENWGVYHSDVGNNKALFLNLTNAESSASNAYWNNTSPTSSVFSVNTSTSTNAANTMIAYCFHSVAGYSSIGTYSGTDSPGVTVTTGFRPAFVMIKATNLVEGWAIIDGTRDTINPRNKVLKPNSSNAEVSGSQFDIEFTDTGFVLNGTDDVINGYSGGTGEYIYMAFADTREAAFWKDVSGQGNHWTPNNLDYRDSLIDSPANNFAVLNPLLSIQSTFSEGNLKTVTPSNAGNSASTIAMSEGKWYAEFVATSSGTIGQAVGVVQAEGYLYSSNMYEGTNKGIGYYSGNGQEYDSTSGSLVATGYGSTWTTGDVIGVAYDADTSQITFYKNGVSQGTVTLNSTIGAAYFSCGEGQNSATTTFVANFGQDSTFSGARPAGGNVDDNDIGDFAYAPPSGYLALCTANLSTPTIVDGSEYFNTVLYSGTGATQSITGVGFQPDFVWAKRRSATGDHIISDSVRTAGKYLSSNLTAAEITSTDFDSFDSDGFTVNAVDQTGGLNASGSTYASWNWKAGGTAVSNTDGTITSQVSVNTDAGFSIVSYTGNGTGGSTIGHGLSGVDAVIVKRRDSTSHWQYLDKNLASGNVLLLSSTGAATAYSGFSAGGIDNLAATTFSVENGSANCDNVNASGGTYIAYCFANTDTTKAGSYVANQNTDGTFIYLGFRPAFFLAKNISRTQEWIMMNNKTTDPYNPQDGSIQPNSSAAEGTGNEVDFLSNGVKLRNSGGGLNYASGDTFIYLAFAETPFKYANAR